ncbi:MAG: nitrate reductase [Gammaproteobacteria bacterium]|nr:nitrate reductase [Gammaproteobacteria bacterium]
MFLTGLYALLFYFATAVLVLGLLRKIWQYARTPAPLKIATTPAPLSRTGVAFRLAREVVLFESLFRSNLVLAVLGWVFHMTLFLVLARHLRYFTEPVWWWVALIQPFAVLAAFAMLAALVGLWARRFLIDRVRYISAPSDHLMLFLLLAIGASGLMVKFLARTDIVAVKAFFLGLMRFDLSQPLPADPSLLVHLSLVAMLMIILPFSKLLHIPGVFFSPTRNQVDNPRAEPGLRAHTSRHIAPWAAELDAPKSE